MRDATRRRGLRQSRDEAHFRAEVAHAAVMAAEQLHDESLSRRDPADAHYWQWKSREHARACREHEAERERYERMLSCDDDTPCRDRECATCADEIGLLLAGSQSC